MRVPLSNVGCSGRMELTFALQDGRTVLRDSYCEMPFKVTRVLDSQQSIAHLILMHCTAGLFGGDEVQSSIRIESGARVRITQQSATKIHPAQDRRVIQRSQIYVGTGAELQLYLEPVIPFANSRLNQSTTLNIEPGGTLYYWEGFMSGRIGSGESWQFSEFMSETQLFSEKRLIYLDRFHLNPNSLPQSTWAMGNQNYWGTGLYVGNSAVTFTSKLHRILPEAGVDALAKEAVVARVVSNSGPDFHRDRELFCRLTDMD